MINYRSSYDLSGRHIYQRVHKSQTVAKIQALPKGGESDKELLVRKRKRLPSD